MPSRLLRDLRRFWRLHRGPLAVAGVLLAALAATFVATDRTPSPGGIVPVPVKTAPVREAPVGAGCRSQVRRPPRRAAKVLPPGGRPVVAGIRLPRGSRCGLFWSTDAPVPDAVSLARRLASAFPRTGLWPVLWAWPPEEPDGYFPAFAELPPPARPAATVRTRVANPFTAHLARVLAREEEAGRLVVMLVPVERPADVLAALRPAMTEHFGDEELSAVLRSWEERFGAVVVALQPSALRLVVDAPPRTEEQARRLAAEHQAFAPEDDVGTDLDVLAAALRPGGAPVEGTSARVWDFGWPD